MEDILNKIVAEGAAWLDEVSPGWERKVDLDNLDLMGTWPPSEGATCLLCQVTGLDWDKATIELESRTTIYRPYAFAYHELEPIWIELIKERFNSGTLSDSHLA